MLIPTAFNTFFGFSFNPASSVFQRKTFTNKNNWLIWRYLQQKKLQFLKWFNFEKRTSNESYQKNNQNNDKFLQKNWAFYRFLAKNWAIENFVIPLLFCFVFFFLLSIFYYCYLTFLINTLQICFCFYYWYLLWHP